MKNIRSEKKYWKISLLIIVNLLLSISANALESLPQQLEKALKLPPPQAADQIYALTTRYIIDAPVDSIPKNRKLLVAALSQSHLPDKNALLYEIEAQSSKNLLILKDAKFYVKKGLSEPNISKKLSIRFLTLLAAIETDLENYLVAVENYQIIEKILVEEDEEDEKIAMNFMGLADLYLKTGLYKEAIGTLNKGINLIENEKLSNIGHLFYNKMAIVYFYLRKPDSLQYYTDKAFDKNSKLDKESVSFHRLRYMKLILENNPAAIDEIRTVINSPKDDDELMSGFHLVQAYVQFNQLKKAKKFILVMLATGDLKNLTFLTSQLYKILSDIYLQEGDPTSALVYYKKNVAQLTLYVEKQFKSDNILTILKYHEIKERYNTIEKDLQVRKNYFVMSIIIGLMLALTFFLLYRAVLAKKRFNKLAYDKLNNEISIINSHDVRKHLSNILGIMNVIQLSDDQNLAYFEMEKSLLESAENLDSSIKTIASKIEDYK